MEAVFFPVFGIVVDVLSDAGEFEAIADYVIVVVVLEHACAGGTTNDIDSLGDYRFDSGHEG
jgi:hypothetical protein